MDKDFQTSFIPKKSMMDGGKAYKQPTSFITLVSLFLFFAVLIATAVLFFYKASINAHIAQMQHDIEVSKSRVDPDKIAEFQALDKRLKAATEIFSQHVTVTPIFLALDALTMKDVRYTHFTYTLGTPDLPDITVKMSGVAVGYRAIALQSDLFGTNKNIIDPVFTDLTLDDTGNVAFDLQFSVDPNFVNYKADTALTAAANADANMPPATSATDTTDTTDATDTPAAPVDTTTPPPAPAANDTSTAPAATTPDAGTTGTVTPPTTSH